ncbi:MAG TPA: VOC family protein [Candidatus Limnocylindrales bacterium]|nr:VOC family protein [Candidatus Limnocylindrales bacterium]
MTSHVVQLRVALTVDDHEVAVAFYRDGLGMDTAAIWTGEQGKAVMLEGGAATLELFDERQASSVDAIEAGERVSGPVRLAFTVGDLDAALQRALAYGGVLVHAPVVTPWGDRNARVQAPDGLQITLFQAADRQT